MDEMIKIGKIVKPIGLKGQIKVLPETQNVKRYKKLTEVIINGLVYKVNGASVAGNEKVILTLNGVDSIEKAEKLRDKELFVNRKDAIVLSKDEFFAVDLVGCKMYDAAGNFVGLILNIENYGASDIINYCNSGKNYTLAFVEGLFLDVDLINKKIVVSEKIKEVSCEI